MIEALHYKDEKSDKFWRVETSGCMMLVNWGKTGTNGRWQMTEYDTEENCEKAASKLVSSKKKKDYKEMPEFDSKAQTYFDIDEYGPHPLTSHPVFREYFSDELYYDCADEEAPFGSDEGSDTLALLQLEYKPGMDFAVFPKHIMEEEWGLVYLPPVMGQTDDELKEQAAKMYDFPGDEQMHMSDQVITATALGQIKITGKIDKDMLNMLLLSLDRRERMYRGLPGYQEYDTPYGIEIIKRDINNFKDAQ